MTKHQLKPIAWLWGAVVTSIVMLLLSSCSTMKDTMRKNLKEAAVNCNELFPVIEKTDDAAFKKSQDSLKALAATIDKMKEDHAIETQVLLDNLERFSEAAPKDCDSVVQAAKDIVADSKAKAREMEKKINDLTRAAENVAPVVNTKKSTAEILEKDTQLNTCAQNLAAMADVITAKQSENDKLRAENAALKKDLQQEKSRGGLLIPWWIIIAVIAYTITSGIRGSLNPLKWLIKK